LLALNALRSKAFDYSIFYAALAAFASKMLAFL